MTSYYNPEIDKRPGAAEAEQIAHKFKGNYMVYVPELG